MAPAKKAAKKSPAKKTTAKKSTAKKSTAKKSAKKTAKKAGSRDSVVVTSKVRMAVADQGLRMDRALVDALNEQVHEMLTSAGQRARDNRRGTVRPFDL